MKKMVLLLLATGMAHAVGAQSKKGNWLIGTGIGSAVINFGNTESIRGNGTVYIKKRLTISVSQSCPWSVIILPTMPWWELRPKSLIAFTKEK